MAKESQGKTFDQEQRVAELLARSPIHDARFEHTPVIDEFDKPTAYVEHTTQERGAGVILEELAEINGSENNSHEFTEIRIETDTGTYTVQRATPEDAKNGQNYVLLNG